MQALKNYFTRHNDYLPIGRHPQTRKSTARTLIAAVLVLLSLVLNIVFIVKYYKSLIYRPLDNYQQLKHYPLVSPNVTSLVSTQNSTDNAIVTTLYTDSYAPAVAALGHSLNRVKTSARLIVLYVPSRISDAALCVATSSGFVPHPVTIIPPPHNGTGVWWRFQDQFTKLQLWTLDKLPEPVHAAVYLDADTLVTRNFDELFSLPYPFAAVPDVFLGAKGWTVDFNAGVMLLRPDSSLFNAMLADLPNARFPPDMAEQAFLNQYFATDVLRLPYVYNGNLAIKARSPSVWEGIKDEMRIIHYTLGKPFLTSKWGEVPLERLEERIRAVGEKDGGIFREEMDFWAQIWRETVVAYSPRLDECRRMSHVAHTSTISEN